MFYIKRWDNDEVIRECPKLGLAKRYARGQGHTGEDHPHLTSYPPIAYVANEAGELVYNPRFSKQIRSDVGALINTQPSDRF